MPVVVDNLKAVTAPIQTPTLVATPIGVRPKALRGAARTLRSVECYFEQSQLAIVSRMAF